MRQVGRVGLPVVEGDVGPEVAEDVEPPGRDPGAGQVQVGGRQGVALLREARDRDELLPLAGLRQARGLAGRGIRARATDAG